MVGAVIEQRPPLLLRLKLLLRDVHPAVWRRVTLADSLSIADLHRVVQLLMGWDDDHLHRFRIHGRDYGIAYIGGASFDEDAATVPLSQFGFHPTERFLYEYDFTAGWQVELRVEKVIEEAPCESHSIPVCVAGREPGPPDGCGGPQAYAERRRDAVSWDMATDMDAVLAVLRRVADGDDAVLADPETFSDFKHAVSCLRSREPFLAEAFPRDAINTALRQAFTIVRGPP
jgi:Plasmid pRiA4b ORF-3-like protein